MTSYVTFGLILIAANHHLCVSDQREEWNQYEDIYDYVLGLRERSENMLIYLTRIQKIFCPEQPVCNEGQTDETSNDTILFENLYIGNESKPVKDLKYLVGVCCSPCSCSDRCSEDNNCCLSKDLASVTSGVVKSECISATARAYQRKLSTPGNMYSMINHCFRNDTDLATISKCESPDVSVIGDTIPVTSLTTGRIYWNTPCATCNADADDVLPWNSTAIFDAFFLHIQGMTSQQIIPQSPEEFYTYLLDYVRPTIIYTPPIPMQHKRCLSEFQVCTAQENDLANENDRQSFFFDTCQQHSSPVVIGLGFGQRFKNIFCFFCQKRSYKSRTNCEVDRDGRLLAGQVSALLNYRKSTDDDHDVPSTSDLAGDLRGRCACTQVYDTNIDDCRPLFCPPGEFFGACQCVKLMNNITGMRMFLRLKVEAHAGQPLPSSEAKRRKMRIALRKVLTTTSKGNDVEIVATFSKTNSDRSYYFVIATVTSTPGNDIKEATKPFLGYLDDSNSIEISFDKTKLMVRLTNRVQFWSSKNEGSYLFKAKEINSNSELTPMYLNEILLKSTAFKLLLRIDRYQILSPLLFCSQVQLDGNEFQENNGVIQVNTTSLKISVYDYIQIDDTHVRVCVDDYLQAPGVSSGAGQNLQTSALLCFSIIISVCTV